MLDDGQVEVGLDLVHQAGQLRDRLDVGADLKRGQFGGVDTTGSAVAERSRIAAELRKTAFAQQTDQRTARRGSSPSF